MQKNPLYAFLLYNPNKCTNRANNKRIDKIYKQKLKFFCYFENVKADLNGSFVEYSLNNFLYEYFSESFQGFTYERASGLQISTATKA